MQKEKEDHGNSFPMLTLGACVFSVVQRIQVLDGEFATNCDETIYEGVGNPCCYIQVWKELKQNSKSEKVNAPPHDFMLTEITVSLCTLSILNPYVQLNLLANYNVLLCLTKSTG
jgi:hypothetical protein